MIRGSSTFPFRPCQASCRRVVVPFSTTSCSGGTSKATFLVSTGASSSSSSSTCRSSSPSSTRTRILVSSFPVIDRTTSCLFRQDNFLQPQARFFGSTKLGGMKRDKTQHFEPLPLVSYGVRSSKAYRASKQSMRKAAVHARRQEERQGFLLDTKKCLQMELKRNTGIGWTRSLKILKHLECHVRTKGPPCNQQFREKCAKIAWMLKSTQGPTRP
ncbi:unnamed protein product [Amoebophrya sp. A120]|nr:unnamed protein product [Amoebophrya sp. A120]|eukprot:GSA120T00020750001.1